MRGALAKCVAVLCVAGLIAASTARGAEAQTPEKLKVAIGAAGLYFIVHFVAEGAGFFKKEGLELDTVDVTTGPRQVAAVMGGSVDIAPLGLQLVIQATSRGGSIRRAREDAIPVRRLVIRTSCRLAGCG